MPDRDDDAALAIMRLAWRIDALDEWRRQLDAWKATTDKVLSELTMTDKIAEAVAAKMSERHGFYLTRVQTLIAVCALVVPPILSATLVRVLGG